MRGAYFIRKENGNYTFFTPNSGDWYRVHQVHTVGIPFEAMAYTLKLPVGIGIGLVGNLNLNQPYFDFLLRTRFGNPALKNTQH
jgi:hypothetical protein